MGCDGLIVQGADTTAGGGSVHSGVTIGTVRGYRGICIQFGGARAEQSMPAPAGALGYRFTDSVENAEKICREIGGGWSSSSPDAYRCDRVPQEIGFAGSTEMTFCDGKLCTIEVIAPRVSFQMQCHAFSEASVR